MHRRAELLDRVVIVPPHASAILTVGGSGFPSKPSRTPLPMPRASGRSDMSRAPRCRHATAWDLGARPRTADASGPPRCRARRPSDRGAASELGDLRVIEPCVEAHLSRGERAHRDGMWVGHELRGWTRWERRIRRALSKPSRAECLGSDRVGPRARRAPRRRSPTSCRRNHVPLISAPRPTLSSARSPRSSVSPTAERFRPPVR